MSREAVLTLMAKVAPVVVAWTRSIVRLLVLVIRLAGRQVVGLSREFLRRVANAVEARKARQLRTHLDWNRHRPNAALRRDRAA